MIGAAVATVVVGLIMAVLLDLLLETILKFCLQLAFTISTEILDPSTFTFKLTTDSGGGLLGIIPGDIDILKIFKTIAWVLLILNTVFAIIKASAGGISGNLTKNPAQYALGGIATAVLLVLFFGVGNVQGLIYWFGDLFDNFMKWTTSGMLGEDGKLAITAAKLSTDVGTAMGRSSFISSVENGNQIVNTIFAIALMSGVVGASITHIERYLSFAIFILFGPVCIAFNSAEETKDTTREWFSGIISQALAIILSILCWRLFFVQVVKEWTLFNLVVTLAILSLIKKSEQILNMVGFRTMPSQDAARSFLGAAATTAIAARSAARAIGRTSLSAGKKQYNKSQSEKKASAELYANRNNAKTERDIANANAKYRTQTASLRNGFKGKDPDKAYANAQKRFGAIPTAKSEIKDKKDAIDRRCAEEIKNASSAKDVERALQSRNRSYENLPGTQKPEPITNSRSLQGTEGNKLQRDMSENLNRISNGMITNGNPELEERKATQMASFNQAIFGNDIGYQGPTSSYTPAFKELAESNNGHLAPQLEMPGVDNAFNSDDNTRINGVATEHFNDLTMGNIDKLDRGEVSNALVLSDYGYDDNGAMRGKLEGLGEDATMAVAISELVNLDTGHKQLYAILPSEVSIPDGARVSCDVGEASYDSALYELEANKGVFVGDGMQAVPLHFDDNSESYSKYNNNNDYNDPFVEAEVANSNLSNFVFTDNSSADVDTNPMNMASEAYADAKEEMLKDTIDYAESQRYSDEPKTSRYVDD